MKDKVTNICGIVIVLAGALIAADKTGQLNLGPSVDAVLSIIVTLGTAIVAIYTGKTNEPK